MSASAGRSAPALGRERLLILGLLLGLAAGAWAFLLTWPAVGPAPGPGQLVPTGTSESMGDMAAVPSVDTGQSRAALTMGMAAPLFLSLWVVMMVAMMFPTAAPMVLMFARVGAARRTRGSAFVPTWVFVGAYLLVWTAFGVVAFVVVAAAQGAAQSSAWLMDNAARVGGVAILCAGLYQLTPLKRVCLTTCRSPLSFLTKSWRDGYAGAVKMGLEHGAYCLGCCWLLFVILFPLGIMNVAAMAALTALIFAEKSWPMGVGVSRVAAVLLVGYGVLVLFVPAALPGMAPIRGEM